MKSMRILASRRFFGLPAWFWVILPIPLLALADSLFLFWPPGPPAEPSERAEIFREVILVTRDGDTFRIVPFEKAKSVKPLWAISVIVQRSSKIAWTTHAIVLPGLYRLQGRWAYSLTSNRFETNPVKNDRNPGVLPPDQIAALRPMSVTELNHRDPEHTLGDRLERLLTRGVERTTALCPQNVIILLSWLSIPMSLLAIGFLVVQSMRVPDVPART